MQRASSRPTRTLLLAAVAALLGACGGDGGDDGDTGRADADPPGFAAAAARHCTDVLNGIDHAAASAAADANIRLLELVLGRDEPAAAEREALREDLEAGLAVRRDVRERLAELQPDDANDADAAAWAAVVDAGDDAIATLETRIELLGGDDWGATIEGFAPGGGDAVGPPQDALEQLELAGRDCEIVAGSVGNPPEHAAFLREASSVCTTVVSRRAAEGYATDAVLKAVAASAAGDGVTSSPELLAQLDAMALEWEQTVEDLEAVPTDDVPDAAAWEDVLAAARERAEVAAARRQALEDDDGAEIERMFTPGATYEHPGLGDLEVLGLDRRDCRSIEP